ncbi:hypothetical protein QYQ99_24330 [Comamonas testosteroni]|jgi:hypothetical protein|uniref:hypothetical protein n=1 Tax=Comamonas testosteroni TaxID=285 RepID=UPI00265DE21F|nr:hypothetical protein [Comamonas testosteroni]WKL15435.1 hypothetical protein QYQ99_24330 [Comamonas testosteroni]WQD41034.1 hypothetical protein U0024_14660 [Comamonas testosteroni]
MHSKAAGRRFLSHAGYPCGRYRLEFGPAAGCVWRLGNRLHALARFLRKGWGNQASDVSESQVSKVRKHVRAAAALQ